MGKRNSDFEKYFITSKKTIDFSLARKENQDWCCRKKDKLHSYSYYSAIKYEFDSNVDPIIF